MVRIVKSRVPAWGMGDVDARGRNGWFEPHRIEVSPDGLCVYSKQQADTPPIVLKIGQDGMARLGLAALQLPTGCPSCYQAVGRLRYDHLPESPWEKGELHHGLVQVDLTPIQAAAGRMLRILAAVATTDLHRDAQRAAQEVIRQMWEDCDA